MGAVGGVSNTVVHGIGQAVKGIKPSVFGQIVGSLPLVPFAKNETFVRCVEGIGNGLFGQGEAFHAE